MWVEVASQFICQGVSSSHNSVSELLVQHKTPTGTVSVCGPGELPAWLWIDWLGGRDTGKCKIPSRYLVSTYLD